jgi:hypothetical protein
VAQEINYKVNAWLTTKGTFLDQMKAGGKAADDFSSQWSSAGQRFSEVGGRIAGTTGQMLGMLAKTGAVGLAGGIGAGLAVATTKGLQFNAAMEDSALTTATMFTAFKMGVNDAKVLSGETSVFAANLERAGAMQAEIYSIAQKSPATYRQVNEQYQMMASGLSGVTTDLERQRSILEKSSVLAGLTEGDYKQLGSDIGRITQGLAGMDVRTFAALQGPFGEAMAEVTKKEIPANLAAAFNALAPEDRLKTLETVLSRIPKEVGEAYGKSFGGIVSTTESALETMAGNFAKPLFESIKTSLTRISSEGGILGGDTLGKLTVMADMFGRKVAKGFERGVSFIEKAVGFLADNWQTMWLKVKQAAVITATAIKIAFVVGLTRMVAGSIISGVGAAMRGASTAKAIAEPIAAWIGQQSRATGMGIARGAKGKGRGITGMIGAGVGEVSSGFAGTRRTFVAMIAGAKGLPAMAVTGFAQARASMGSILAGARGLPAAVTAGFTATKTAFITMAAKAKAMGVRGMAGAVGARARGVGARAGGGMMAMLGKGAPGMMKLATAGTMLVAILGPAIILGAVLGGLMVAFGGVAAYISTKWREISTTLINGIEQGKISLVPLMTGLYTFWMRLVMVGEALVGGGDATSTFNGFLNFAIWTIDAASTGLGYFIQGLSILVGAFGAVKLGITGIVGVIAWMLEMLSKVPKVGEGLADTAAEMRKSQASWMASSQDTFTTSEKLARAADKIFAAKLSPEDMGAAADKAKKLEDRLKGFLSGESKANKPKGAKVHVDKVTMNIDLQEPDPDRVMALLVKPLEKLASGRTQAFSATEQGA